MHKEFKSIISAQCKLNIAVMSKWRAISITKMHDFNQLKPPPLSQFNHTHNQILNIHIHFRHVQHPRHYHRPTVFQTFSIFLKCSILTDIITSKPYIYSLIIVQLDVLWVNFWGWQVDVYDSIVSFYILLFVPFADF